MLRKTCEILVDIEKCISDFNLAISNVNGDPDERNEIMTKAMIELPDYESEYAKASEYETFLRIKDAEHPMKQAIIEREYPIVRHRDVKDEITKIKVGIELVSSTRKIDLLRFDKFCQSKASNNNLWEYSVSKFNQLLCLRVATKLGADVNKIKKSYYLTKIASDIELGKTPTSNNQVLIQLQRVIDDIIYEDNGNGKNKYKATSHDVEFIDAVYTKKGRDVCTALVSKDSTMRDIITDILYRSITDYKYSVSGYKQNKKVKSN